MKRKTGILTTLAIGAILAGCGANASSSEKIGEGLLDDGVLTVGVTAGPHEDLTNVVKDLAAEDGLEIEVVVFTDFVKPNTALAEGELDINSMQTGPYLDQMIEENGFDFARIASTITIPMGIYSDKYDEPSDFQEGDTIAVPNTPTQEGRALQVLEQTDLITLPEGSGIEVTTDDIVENPLNLEFITGDPAQFTRQLQDVAAAGINSNYMLDAGLSVPEYAVELEDTNDNVQANWVVSRTEDENDPFLQQFIDYYQTDEMKQYIEETFEGAVVPAW